MAILIGGSCGGRYSRPILGITCYENRLLQNNEHKYFWEDTQFCIINGIYLIVNIDSYITGGRWRPSNQQLRDFIISTKTRLKGMGATKANCRVTTDNESEEYEGFNDYTNWVRVIHDALAGQFDLGAGNFGTNKKDWYEQLASLYSTNCYEVFDVHYQNGLDDNGDITLFSNWILFLKNKYQFKRIAITEGNNFYNTSTQAGHNLLKFQIQEAERIGCEAFCFVFVNWMHNGEETDEDMSYNWNYNPVSSYWGDMLNFIKSKKPIIIPEVLDMIELQFVKPGSKNEETRAVQQIMIDEGYDLSPYGADSIYGKITETAIKKWQTDNGLKVDGWVGKETWQWILGNITTGLTRFLQLIVREASFR
ncbi:MAG: peptidoglycan-binding domain-containing protein [Candidatus Humimicrobiaceae bacterium]